MENAGKMHNVTIVAKIEKRTKDSGTRLSIFCRLHERVKNADRGIFKNTYREYELAIDSFLKC